MGVQGDISFLPLAGSVLSLIKDVKLRALGMAQAERNPLAPNIPTLGEIDPQLKRFDYPTWAGWLVKADTPDAEVARLQAALTKALADPKVIAAIRASGSDIAKPLSTAQADAFYTDQTKQIGRAHV